MPSTQMTIRQGRFVGYEYHEIVSDGATGLSVIIPPLGSEWKKATCTLTASANTGKFQYTTSSDAEVLTDAATWIDWPNGDTTGDYSAAVISPITALRGVSVSGDIVIDIVV